MAQTSYIDLTPEQENLFFKCLSSGDRFVFPRVRRKLAFVSIKKKKGLTQRSMLPQVSALWNNFSDDEKTAWKNAAAQSNMRAYNLFVQDQCIRIKNDIEGVATPSLLHQSWVGYANIESPASEIKIAQYHPRSYYVLQSVKGKKGMKEPVLITEDFSLPLQLKINYKSNLSSVGSGSFARFYATIRSSYQGIDRFTDCIVPLDLSTDWKSATETINSVIGYMIGYTLYIHLYNVRGILYFDNLAAVHSSQNWLRDPVCKNINEGFTRAFYQVPKNWVGVEIPEGSSFESIYPI
jgi:hypothetical protein